MNVYLRLFRLPGVRRQTVAASLSRMTQPLLTLPLLVGIGEAYDDHALAAFTVGLYTAAFALMMPITGRLVDRHGARMILRLWLGFALTALIGTAAAVTLHAPVPIVIIVVVLLGACLPPVGVVTRAGWPILVPTTQLRAAYALDSVITEASMITGPCSRRRRSRSCRRRWRSWPPCSRSSPAVSACHPRCWPVPKRWSSGAPWPTAAGWRCCA